MPFVDDSSSTSICVDHDTSLVASEVDQLMFGTTVAEVHHQSNQIRKPEKGVHDESVEQMLQGKKVGPQSPPQGSVDLSWNNVLD